VLEALLPELRAAIPALIDLRPAKTKDGYVLECSLIRGADDAQSAALLPPLERELKQGLARRSPTLPVGEARLEGAEPLPALTMHLLLVEEPLENQISPITRVVNRVLGLFGAAPAPERRLSAMARNLRVLGETEHVRVKRAAGHEAGIEAVAVLKPEMPKSTTADAITDRLKARLAATGGDALLGQARALYDRIENAASTQRLTVARPVIASGYAPMKYDYMSGYIWTFIMALIGLAITFYFVRREKRGLIRKRGVEEAMAS
jgi:hypothetical protein